MCAPPQEAEVVVVGGRTTGPAVGARVVEWGADVLASWQHTWYEAAPAAGLPKMRDLIDLEVGSSKTSLAADRNSMVDP